MRTLLALLTTCFLISSCAPLLVCRCPERFVLPDAPVMEPVTWSHEEGRHAVDDVYARALARNVARLKADAALLRAIFEKWCGEPTAKGSLSPEFFVGRSAGVLEIREYSSGPSLPPPRFRRKLNLLQRTCTGNDGEE